jgi:phosphatidylglycerophosphate synthase
MDVPARAAPAIEDESYLDTVRRLSSAQKSRKGGPAYSVFVNRRLGRLLAAAAYHLGLTPNGVTGISAVASFSAIALIATGRPSWALAAAVTLLLVLGYALDSADGQLARLRGGGSVSGEWLDHIVDALKISSLHLAVLLILHRSGDVDDVWLLVPMGYTVVGAVSFFAQILNEQLHRNHGGTGPAGAASAGQGSSVQALLKVPTDYGILCWVFVLLGAPGAFLVAYGVMFAGSSGYLALALVKWYRDVRSLDERVVG